MVQVLGGHEGGGVDDVEGVVEPLIALLVLQALKNDGTVWVIAPPVKKNL